MTITALQFATYLAVKAKHFQDVVHYQGGETEQIISVICHVTKHKYYLLLYLTMLNLKNGLPIWFSLMNIFLTYDLLIDMYCRSFRIVIILLFIGTAIFFAS